MNIIRSIKSDCKTKLCVSICNRNGFLISFSLLNDDEIHFTNKITVHKSIANIYCTKYNLDGISIKNGEIHCFDVRKKNSIDLWGKRSVANKKDLKDCYVFHYLALNDLNKQGLLVFLFYYNH